MMQGVGTVGLYVRDQDEALAFYVDKLGFRVHTDVRNGDYRWLTVQHADQPLQLGLLKPGPPGIILFAPNGEEIPDSRVIGYQNPEKFLASLARLP